MEWDLMDIKPCEPPLFSLVNVAYFVLLLIFFIGLGIMIYNYLNYYFSSKKIKTLTKLALNGNPSDDFNPRSYKGTTRYRFYVILLEQLAGIFQQEPGSILHSLKIKALREKTDHFFLNRHRFILMAGISLIFPVMVASIEFTYMYTGYLIPRSGSGQNFLYFIDILLLNNICLRSMICTGLSIWAFSSAKGISQRMQMKLTALLEGYYLSLPSRGD